MPDIKFLNPVDIRQVWKREDTDFTPWLANEEPLKVLLEECGIDLGADFQVRTELKIPGVNRKLDLYVQTESMQSIAIENQYSEADHDHFTRALAYAVGLDTNVVIVVAENHREEFDKAQSQTGPKQNTINRIFRHLDIKSKNYFFFGTYVKKDIITFLVTYFE